MERKFTEKLENWKKNNILTPLMVLWASKIGKTYIINEFCKNNFDDYIYINLADHIDIIEIFDIIWKSYKIFEEKITKS